MTYDFREMGVGTKITVNNRRYEIHDEQVGPDGRSSRRILIRQGSGSAYNRQKKINAFNFPFTGNSGGGCLFQCSYCFLRTPFFQIGRSLPHGQEMDTVRDFPGGTERFLKKNAGLPQYMKRVQWGVATEMWHPLTLTLGKPGDALKKFQEHGQDWMLHVVTKSPRILDWADLLAEMKHQVQVEVSFVTLDEEASRIFETGTPSVRRRLEIVEKLANRGVFVRVMMMPCMREYELQDVDGRRHILFANKATGERAPGYKEVTERDGNAEGDQIGITLLRERRWDALPLTESRDWKPVVVKDWSRLDEAQREWKNWGAMAYKQKDLNYYYVDELIRAHEENRAPRRERGRVEDPTAEYLVHSGESVRDDTGAPKMIQVEAWHKPKPRGGTARPIVGRCVMDFGYRLHSKIDWIDCV